MSGGWWLRRLRVLFRKRVAEDELDEEIRYHIERETEENLRAGMPPAEARRRALVAFGGVERHKEEVRDVRGARILDDLVMDARIAMRSFLREPAFTLAVLLTLGLGIGGNVAMFGILEGSLLRALPYPESERLVLGRVTRNGQLGQTVSGPDFFDYREQSSSFQRLAAYTPFSQRMTLTGQGEPDRISLILASTGFFSTLGVEPFLGREFTPEEGELGGPAAVVISHGLWERRFGSDPGVLGRTAVVSGSPLTVVGVMPAGFRFAVDVDAWVPLQRGGPWAQARQFHNFVLVGRLQRGVDLARAQDEVDRISTSLAEAYPDTNRNKGLNLTYLRQALSEEYTTSLAVLMAAVAVLLLIACGNVAGLLLARGSARGGELAVRSVMGAGRGRLGRQLLTENAVLALGAGAVGLLIAVWLQRGILAFVSLERLGGVTPGLSTPMVAVALGLSLTTVLLFGVAPAVRVARTDPARDLRAGTRSTESRGGTRLRGGLVVAQVALTVVLLSVSGLLIRSLSELRGVDLGFDPSDLLTASVQVPASEYTDGASRVEFFRQLGERVATLPGVRSVGFVSRLPVRDPGGNVRVDRPENFGVSGIFGSLADQRSVLPGYFEAMGIPILAGRDVAMTDDASGPPVILLSRSAADQIFAGEDPLGRTVAVDQGGSEPALLEVVGVVGDVVTNHPAQDDRRAMYFAYGQSPNSRLGIAVRAPGAVAATTSAVRGVLREMDPDIPLAEAATMEAELSRVVSDNRAIAAVLGVFAATALLLAGIGLYGVLAYQVTRRVHEIGIRMALGADVGQVLRSVVWGGARLAILGLVLGIPASLWTARLAQGLLFGVGTTDPATYAGVALFMGVVAGTACLWPAWRAARVDPVEAFRAE